MCNPNLVPNFIEKNIFTKEDLSILNLDLKRIEIDQSNYRKLIEHLYSWVIYFDFFERFLFSDKIFQ